MSFAVIRKEAGTNFVLNPSAELAGNFAAHNGSTVDRDVFARFGIYTYVIVSSGVNQGINLTLGTLANAIHHVTFYSRTVVTGILQVSLDSGATYNTAVAISSVLPTRWTRYQITIPAAQANGSTALIVRNTVNENWSIDSVQVEATNGYFTTYIDGDQGEGYRWAGLKHGSISTRKDDVRTGGRELTFRATEADTPDIEAIIQDNGTGGLGITGIINNTLPFALQPGAAYQNAKLLSRIIELEMSIFGDNIATHDEVLSQRKLISDIWKPDAASPGQATPFIHNAVNINRKLFIDTYLESGLEVVGGLESNRENLTMRLLAVSPLWREDDNQTDELDFQDTDTDADFIMARIDGAWIALGTGASNNVLAIAYDEERGRVYFGGTFVTANGVTVNSITYWDGATFVVMGATPGVAGGSVAVNAIAIAPNGDVWIGGDFTSAGGVASQSLARFDISTGAWVVNTDGGLEVNALAIDSTGTLYVVGSFTNWDGQANGDRIISTSDDGVTWDVLSTGLSGTALALAIDQADNVYVGGLFVTAGGVTVNNFTRWDGTTFIALGSGTNGVVRALAIGKNGLIYLGGGFTDVGSRIATWSGTDFDILGVGVSSDVRTIAISPAGIILVGGDFITAGGLAVADRLAGWNGSSWFHFDIDLPGSANPRAILAIENEDIYLAYITSGTATIAGSTTVTYNGTATVSPVITILGPTTANTTVTLQWLENQTTGERLYFNMPINTDEIITIDTRPNSVGITSNFRGAITDNPLDPGGLSLFNLLPGDNIIAAFITGTITGVRMLVNSNIVHHGIEGVAI